MSSGKLLFNFAASYSGGGLKRLYGYANWFDRHGGANFIIHRRCAAALAGFRNNRFFIVDQPRYQRLFNDCGYLDGVIRENGPTDMYYSYGIPLYRRVARVNWFHLSNVLPLYNRGIPLPLIDRLKFGHLGRRIKRHLDNADVISAESNHSLELIGEGYDGRLFVSVNGSDDELDHLGIAGPEAADNVACIVGTDRYKALGDSYRVFEMLQGSHPDLTLTIIGGRPAIPAALRTNNQIRITGILPRSEVIDRLRRSKYYISTTRIENSYNAASEGVFLASESYISDIGPHRELLTNVLFERVEVPGLERPLLHVKKIHVAGAHLKTWHDVITEMIGRIPGNCAQ
jgi:hypothetical protein